MGGRVAPGEPDRLDQRGDAPTTADLGHEDRRGELILDLLGVGDDEQLVEPPASRRPIAWTMRSLRS